MRIVLDTNIVQEDLLMNSGRFEVLFDYSERTQSEFILPRIVHDELAANYERSVRERLQKAVRAREQLDGILLQPERNQIKVDVDTVVREYMEYVLRRFQISPNDIYEYKDDYLRDVLQRAIQRQRPCTDRGEEIRDAVLWRSVLDIAEADGEPVVFISRNTKQFSQDGTTLHPDLLAEVAARGTAIEYVPSLEEFAKQHASPIAFITKEWIEAQIDPDAVYDGVFEHALETAYKIAHSRADIGEEVEDSYTNAGGAIELEEFFVYAMQKGRYRVESTWYGRASVEYDVIVDDWLWGDRNYNRRTNTRTAEVLLHAIVEAFVDNGKVSEWRIIDASAERD